MSFYNVLETIFLGLGLAAAVAIGLLAAASLIIGVATIFGCNGHGGRQ